MDHGMVFSVVSKSPKDTWNDWHLIPTSRPSFPPPPIKHKFVDVPGRNGSYDISTWPTGNVSYGNIQMSVEFIFADGPGYGTWVDRYTEIMNYLHGQYGSVYLDDDPQYYYLGRFTVKGYKPGKVYSTIVIDLDLQPEEIDGWA